MATGGAPPRQLRRGPAPIASFDHDVSDESSPETKQAFRLPEIREHGAAGSSLVPPEQRARSHSSPAVGAVLGAAPRIDISRASSSSQHDSHDSSPERALLGGDEPARLALGFREDGALELRSSTEELAFLEAPGERPAPRRTVRADSQGSEAALLAVSGRTSRLSSVGSQCSALSAYSRASAGRLSVVSGVSATSRSPSPHRMLLETSFCGPKPIETDPEICAAAVEERLLELAKLSGVDARDRREVRTEATVERRARSPPPSTPATTPKPASPPAAAPAPATAQPAAASATGSDLTVVAPVTSVATISQLKSLIIHPASPQTVAPPAPVLDDDKLQKETQNRARVQERRARPRVRREPSEPEVYKSMNRTKDIIRIKLKPDEDDDEEMTEEATEGCGEVARKPVTLQLTRPEEPTPARDARTPSPGAAPVSRKSSFCSLFKSRETIASPDSPSDALRRKRSLTEGRSRSKSRDRSATPSSGGKIRGSVLSLFRTPRRSAASPSPSSRDGSPSLPLRAEPAERPRADRLKYYEDAKDGIIHIPLRTPPDECPSFGRSDVIDGVNELAPEPTATRDRPRPASAPHPRDFSALPSQKPLQRTVLPDGSIIIPLHSPTEGPPEENPPSPEEVVASPVTSQTSEIRLESTVQSTAQTPASGTSSDPKPGHATDPIGFSEPERVEVHPPVDEGRRRRKERSIFTTHVGSRDQVFSTQFSITKTPSVTSEISGSFPSFAEGEAQKTGTNSITGGTGTGAAGNDARDSSGSEASSDGVARGGSDAERRRLVVQESFEDELPYVPTTLPQERSVALPMVPVRERAGLLVAAVERPRAAPPRPALPLPAPPHPSLPLPAPHCPVLPLPAAPHPDPPPPADKLRIRLPRRPRTASVAAPTPVRPERVRSRSGSDGTEAKAKTEWIDFEEVPERRKQPKRIQTLPAAAAGGVVFSYVEPEHCRCECHTRDDDSQEMGEQRSPAHHSSIENDSRGVPPMLEPRAQ